MLNETGIPFTQVMYLRLVTVANYAVQKYAKKPASNGTDMSLREFVCRTKKGSKRFRRVLSLLDHKVPVENLRVVQTFFRLLPVEIPDPNVVRKLYLDLAVFE